MNPIKQTNLDLDEAFGLYEKGCLDAAEKRYEELSRNLRFYHRRAQRMNLLMGMSYVKSALKKHDEARVCCEQLLQHSRLRKGMYIALHQSATVEGEAGDQRKALEFLNREMELLEKYYKKDPQKHAICQYERAGVLLLLGRKQDALYAVTDAARRVDQCRDENVGGHIYRRFGEIQRMLGDEGNAVPSFKKALDYFEEAEDSDGAKEVKMLIKEKQAARVE
ncbi:MAG: hypothetical protein GX123_00435 [Clostridiales bacterium]|jgi:tetratricopeptide (TPR) repeat protein|nr:hypothetical protein [Clostridiales bacterium]